MPLQDAALAVAEGLEDVEGEFRKGNIRTRDGLGEYRLGGNGDHLIIIYGTVVAAENDANLLLRGSKDLETDSHLTIGRFYDLTIIPAIVQWFNGQIVQLLDVHDEVFAGLLHHAQLVVGHEVLNELLLLVGHEPAEVGLVLSIDTGHQFYVGAEQIPSPFPSLRGRGAVTLHARFICRRTIYSPPYQGGVGGGSLISQVAVPGASEVAVAPGPLLLAGREVMAGHVQHTGLGVVLVTALEVVA